MATYRLLINPISGTKKAAKKKAASDLERLIRSAGHKFDQRYTYYKGHGLELAEEAEEDGVDVLILAGGDGTINEVIPALLESNLALAILPLGSGNGIARSLGIPIALNQAVSCVLNGKEEKVDVGKINDHYFLGITGIGFDAHIARKFQSQAKRGLLKYAWLILKDCISYRAKSIEVRKEGELFYAESFMLSVGNANQFGNNVYLDKSASMKDGKLSLVMIRKTSVFRLVLLLIRSFLGRLPQSKFVLFTEGSDFELITEEKIAHTDGEPIEINSPVKISLKRNGISIILPFD